MGCALSTPDVGGEGLGVKPGAPGSGGAAAAAASAVKAAPGGGVHHAAPVDGVHRAAPAGAAHNSGAPPPRPSNGSGAADIGARSASVDAAASVAPAAPGAAGAAGGKAPPAGAAGGAAALLHTAPARLEGAPPPAGALARALALPSQPASPSVSASQVRFREPLGPAAPAQAQDDQLVVGSPPESISPLGQHHQLHRQRPLPALPPPALPPAVGSPRRGDGPAPPAGGAPAANGAAPPPAAPPAAPALRSSLRPALRASRTLGAVGGGDAPGGAAPRAGVARGNKLRERRGGVSASFVELQDQLTSNAPVLPLVATRAAGLKHIGFGPFKRENQDEFFIQVGHYGGLPGANLFCVFDGHGSHGKDASAYSRQVLPVLLDTEFKKFFTRNPTASDPIAAASTKGAVEVLITEVFSETERSLTRAGVNLANSGTTASVAFQLGNRLWVAAAGDSRVILCQRAAPDSGKFRPQPLTIDHRPRRLSERERIEAAGARVQPKRLPSGRLVGEPRMWLQEAPSPGLLLSRSLGDLMAATVGCTSDPEITYATLTPGRDQFVVLASDGVWDVLTNEQVCDIVTESPDPHIACRRVLDAALYEWEERMSADNISVLVVELDWGDLDRSGTEEELRQHILHRA